MAKVIRVKYENGVLKPSERLDIPEGEVLLVKVIERDLAEKAFGSIRVDKKVLERVLREAEDELGIY